jgi:hypothetical protein
MPRRWSGARLALWGNMMSAQLTLHDDDANPCVSHRQSRAPKQHPRKLLEDRGTSGVNRATIYRARSGSVLLVGLQVRRCGLNRRHRPPVGLAQLSRRYPRLVLSERIRPEHRLMSSRIPDEPIAPTKGPSSVAVGIVRRAGHGGHDLQNWLTRP